MDLPLTTLQEEARVLQEQPDAAPQLAVPTPESTLSWGYSALSSVWGTAASYFGVGAVPVTAPGTWSRDIDEIAKDGVPPILLDLTKVILEHCVSTEGIFRRSAKVGMM